MLISIKYLLAISMMYIIYLSYMSLRFSKYPPPYFLEFMPAKDFCVGEAWLAAHFLTWYPLVFIRHIIEGYPCTLVGIFSWNVSGSLGFCQRYHLLSDPWELTILRGWFILLVFSSIGFILPFIISFYNFLLYFNHCCIRFYYHPSIYPL